MKCEMDLTRTENRFSLYEEKEEEEERLKGRSISFCFVLLSLDTIVSLSYSFRIGMKQNPKQTKQTNK